MSVREALVSQLLSVVDSSPVSGQYMAGNPR